MQHTNVIRIRSELRTHRMHELAKAVKSFMYAILRNLHIQFRVHKGGHISRRLVVLPAKRCNGHASLDDLHAFSQRKHYEVQIPVAIESFVKLIRFQRSFLDPLVDEGEQRMVISILVAPGARGLVSSQSSLSNMVTPLSWSAIDWSTKK